MPAEYEQHMLWFEAQLAAARKAYARPLVESNRLSRVVDVRKQRSDVAHIFVFAHHPFFLLRADEPDDGDEFGVTVFVDSGTHQTVRLPNAYFHIPRERRLRVLALMRRFGARLLFSGHYHRNAVVRDAAHDVTQVITSAVGRQLAGTARLSMSLSSPDVIGVCFVFSDDASGFRVVNVGRQLVTYPYFSLDELDAQEAQQQQR